MKRLILWVKSIFVKTNKTENNEQLKTTSHGDLVPLIWMIESLRRREGGCIMNELLSELNKNFKGLEHIKHRTFEYK